MRPRPSIALLTVILGASIAASCRGDRDAVSTERAALDFATGSLEGSVTWQEQPVIGLQGFANVISDVDGFFLGFLDETGHYVIADVAAGTQLLGYHGDCSNPLAERPVTIAPGVTTTADFDLTATAGRVTGVLARNGVPTPGVVIPGEFENGSCGSFFADIDGAFSRLLPAGHYQAQVMIGNQLKTVPITIVAGATTDLGAVDATTGRVDWRLTWNGDPVPGGETMHLDFRLKNSQFNWGLDDVGNYRPFELPPGQYVADLYSNICQTNIAQQSFTVVAGETTSLDIDLTQILGRVQGDVTLNGVPAAAGIYADACGTGFGTDGNGHFDRLLLPGDYVGSINAANPTSYPTVGSFSFTVAAGQVTQVGTVMGQVGSIKGEVTWAGAPISGGNALPLYASERGAQRWWAYLDRDFGTYFFGNLQPRNYVVGIYSTMCEEPLIERSVDITAGPATLTNFDLTNVAGRVSGTITIGGVPAERSVTFDRCQGVQSNPDGSFQSWMMPAGSYSAAVLDLLGNPVHTFGFTVVPGVTTDIGVLDLPIGSVQGTVQGTALWKGAPLTPRERRGLCVTGPWSECFDLDASPTYRHDDAPPGDHILSLYADCGVLAERDVTVTAGATTVADIDLAASAGRVTGSITTNGNVTDGVSIDLGNNCFPDPDASGHFEAFLPPGAYTANVWGAENNFLGAFPFTIVAGQTTDVDGATTPAGTNVPLALAGGLPAVGGLSITFSQVTTTGHTTLAATGVGPAPPSGYRILGFVGQPHYWDIDTSAAYAGSISVCIHYDQAWVIGNESLLRLVHGAGSDFVNITTSLNTTTNVVCGATNSLSPFAIVEPEGPPDTAAPVFAGVPGTVGAYATSASGAVVTYTPPTATDAVDGPRPVSCLPAAGTMFPPNTTTVTCTSTDASGNVAKTSFVVRVTYQAPIDGSFFLKPIRADGSSVFRIGKAVPVKFQLTGASKNVTDLQARLVVTKISDAVAGTADDEGDEDGEDTDFLFKYRAAKKLYGYRWKTRDQSKGTYRLTADLGDGLVHQINVSLKAKK